jgi:DNA-binding transcriptional LysR family regulator
VRRLVPLDYAVAASPAYWRAHGAPAHPRELATHQTLCACPPEQAPRWQFVDGGRPLELSLQPRVSVNDIAPLPALALHDLGVIYVPRAAIRDELQQGTHGARKAAKGPTLCAAPWVSAQSLS